MKRSRVARPSVEPLENRLVPAGIDANVAYVEGLYHDNLGRTASAADVEHWTTILVREGLGSVARGIGTSTEAHAHDVIDLYDDLLGRAPSALELNHFTRLRDLGVPEEQVAIQLLASDEFFLRAPFVDGVEGTPSIPTAVQAAYQIVLDRAPTPTELSAMSNLALVLDGEGVAAALVGSPEYRTRKILEFYGGDGDDAVLQRRPPPSGAELNFWVQSGVDLDTIHLVFASTIEKFDLRRQPLDANQRYVQGLYHSLLGTTADAAGLRYWEDVLLGHGAAVVVNALAQTDAARAHTVASWFSQVLLREPTTAESRQYVGALAVGVRPEVLLSVLYGSEESAENAVSNDASPFISAVNAPVNNPLQSYYRVMHRQLTGRTPGDAEIAARTIGAGQFNRQALALQVLEGPEFRTQQVRRLYDEVLGFPAPDAVAVAWAASPLSLWSMQNLFRGTVSHHGLQLGLAALGDSITDPYGNYTTGTNPRTGLAFWGSRGDQNWVEQLREERSDTVPLTVAARAGATSGDLIGQEQHGAAVSAVLSGEARGAVILVGANDIGAFLERVATGQVADPTAAITELVTNVGTALNSILGAGGRLVVLGNIPDIGQTPQLQGFFLGNAELAGQVSALVNAANAQLFDLARAAGVPLVNLHALGGLTRAPLHLGGVAVTNLFAPDGFHPGTVLQGLLANAILEAQERAYGVNTTGQRLSDQEILDAAGLAHPQGLTYFDVSPYVHFERPTTDGELSAFRV